MILFSYKQLCLLELHVFVPKERLPPLNLGDAGQFHCPQSVLSVSCSSPLLLRFRSPCSTIPFYSQCSLFRALFFLLPISLRWWGIIGFGRDAVFTPTSVVDHTSVKLNDCMDARQHCWCQPGTGMHNGLLYGQMNLIRKEVIISLPVKLAYLCTCI